MSETSQDGGQAHNPADIKPSTVIRRSPDLVAGDLPNEVVLLNNKDGMYYGLNEVGAFVWNQLEEPASVLTLRDKMLENYEVDADRALADLQGLLAGMLDKGLVEIQ